MKASVVVAAVLVIVMGNPCFSNAEMSSDNYRITTSVVSGGGAPMGSANYRLNATIGQPSPLIDPADPPYSPGFDLLTGFWYTLGAGMGCLYDFNSDGDVDGSDLKDFTDAYAAGEVAAFAMQFGARDCF